MNKRVRVDKAAELQTGSGEVQATFVKLTDRWAQIEDLAGREYFNAQQMTVAVSTRIRFRYFPELTEKMRIVYIPDSTKPLVGTLYDVQSVIHTDEGRRETIAMCNKSSVQGYKKEGARA